MKNTINLYFTLLMIVLLSSCQPNDFKFGIFEVQNDFETVIMEGEIGTTTLQDFNDLETAYPDIKTINIVECGGSSDDDINLLLSAKVHGNGINIHLMDKGEIASGGVDFFLAGIERTMGENTKIGVHSWSDGTNEATNFPEGDEVHSPYINYYMSIGFSQSEAEDFYYFTINAATASSIHWMTDAEIEQYGLLTE